jgi:hypothetical protein
MTSTNAIQTLTKDGEKRVEYRDQQGNLLFSHEGGERPWRNNNPGNIMGKHYGAIGTDGDGFAIFPDLETGLKAKYNLLKEDKNYKPEDTIKSAINTYAPEYVIRNGKKVKVNDPDEYLKNIKDWTGLEENKKLSDLTEEEYKHLMYAIARQEGFIDKYGNQKADGIGTRVDHRSPEEQEKNPLPSIKIDPPQRVLDDDARRKAKQEEKQRVIDEKNRQRQIEEQKAKIKRKVESDDEEGPRYAENGDSSEDGEDAQPKLASFGFLGQNEETNDGGDEAKDEAKEEKLSAPENPEVKAFSSLINQEMKIDPRSLLLKDPKGWTEDERDMVMNYRFDLPWGNPTRDAMEKGITDWYEHIYGTGNVKYDSTGRMIDPKPIMPIPQEPAPFATKNGLDLAKAAKIIEQIILGQVGENRNLPGVIKNLQRGLNCPCFGPKPSSLDEKRLQPFFLS